MAQPTLSYDWAGSVDLALQDNTTYVNKLKSVHMALKLLLTGQGAGATPFHTAGGTRTAFWTVEQSCNGSSISTSTDLFGTSATALSIGAGSAHHWCVLKFVGPDHTLRLLIDMNGASFSGSHRLVMTVDEAFTGGTTTLGPTCSKGLIFGDGVNFDSGPNNGVQLFDTSLFGGNTTQCSISVNETDGTFHFLVFRQGDTFTQLYLGAALADSAPAGDNYRLNLLRAWSNGSNSALWCPMAGSNTVSDVTGHLGTIGIFYDGTSPRGTAGGVLTPYFGIDKPNDSNSWAGSGGSGPFLCSLFHLTDGGTSRTRYRGYIPDVYCLQGYPPTSNGDHFPPTGQRKLHVFGNLALPFGAKPTT